jgi:uncharacterized glyoxalase superfamily protein PhnB
MTDRPNLLTPTLRYRDPAAAVDWLSRVFGMRAHFVARAGDEPDAAVAHAQMKLGDALLFLGPDYDDDPYGMRTPLALPGTNQCVCIALDNVDEVYRKAVEAGAQTVNAPRKTPYGAYEFSVKDLEGHVWTVSDYRGEP